MPDQTTANIILVFERLRFPVNISRKAAKNAKTFAVKRRFSQIEMNKNIFRERSSIDLQYLRFTVLLQKILSKIMYLLFRSSLGELCGLA